MKMKRKLVGVLAAALLLAPAPASAIPLKDVSDRNDTHGKFDLRAVNHYKDARNRRVYRMITWGNWSEAEVWDRGYFVVWLDTRWDQRRDYYVLVRSTGRGMRGSLWRDRKTKSDYAIGSLTTYRTTSDDVKVRVRIKTELLARKRTYYRWKAESLWFGGGCPRQCFDRAPDSGYVKQRVS